MDNSIVNYVHSLTEMISIAVVRFGAVIVMSPIFGFPGALLVVVGCYIGQLYSRAQLAVKRERSNARAPILGHTSAAIAGLGTRSDDMLSHLINVLCSIHSRVPRTGCFQTGVL